MVLTKLDMTYRLNRWNRGGLKFSSLVLPLLPALDLPVSPLAAIPSPVSKVSIVCVRTPFGLTIILPVLVFPFLHFPLTPCTHPMSIG